MPGTITPEWQPFDDVKAQALPSASTTEMCVVPSVGRDGRRRRRRALERRRHRRAAAADRLVREHVPGQAAAVQELLEAAVAHPAAARIASA